MGILKVKQITKNGAVKSWKLDAKKGKYTFGTSRKSDLVSIDRDFAPIQGVFQYKNNHWSFSQFLVNEKDPYIVIDKTQDLKLGASTLQLEPVQITDYVIQSLENRNSVGSLKKKILIVSKNNRLLETEVKDLKETFFYSINGIEHKLPFMGSEQWETQHLEGFDFKSRIINVDDVKGLAKLSSSELVDKESKKLLIATFGAALLFMLAGLLTPKKEVPIAEKLELPKSMVVKIEPKKPEAKKPKQASAKQAQKIQQTAAAKQVSQSSASASNNKVKAMLKGAVGLRISKLVGKVSATDARTDNLIHAAQGIKAGSGPSGRALAAVGKIESSGRNWTGEAVDTSGKVNTAGIGGGNSASGLANSLASGGTGSGGVGLIEDESEIEGGLDREVIAQYIKSQLGQILYCYERQLSADPNIFGKVAVRFTISGTGQVVAQNIGDSTLNSRPVEGCILSKVAQWKFPEPRGGTQVNVTYPFLFKSTN